MHCRRRDNIRAPLRADAAVREYLALAARTVAIEETCSVGAEVDLAPEDCCELDRIRLRMNEIERRLALWSVSRLGRNDACWCGSGRKLKKCCIRSAAERDRAATTIAHGIRLQPSPDGMS
jgi:plasmid stability protein